MIDLNDLTTGVFTGMVLILIGLIPGLFQRCADGLFHVMSIFGTGYPSSSRASDRFRQPTWLAPLGAAWIAVTVLGFLSK